MIIEKFNINDFNLQDYEKFLSLTSKDKKAKIQHMHLENDKKRSVVGEMLAKTAISKIAKISLEEIKFSTTQNGKPYIENLDIQFNISHCQDWVVCAIHNKPIGIDIEKIRPINLKIAKRFFTENEQIYLFGKLPAEVDYLKTDDNELFKRFFEIWTGKEAYLKYKGTGITDNLNTLCVNENNLITEFFDDYVVRIYTE